MQPHWPVLFVVFDFLYSIQEWHEDAAILCLPFVGSRRSMVMKENGCWKTAHPMVLSGSG